MDNNINTSIEEEIHEIGNCCFCNDLINPRSQACKKCMRLCFYRILPLYRHENDITIEDYLSDKEVIE